ncbi:MAG: DUF2232 domain-containing protein [Deltaproteobacteria bacterium]|nr:DUF2232 domain-containing protein [Deltaproteobacteria bacterium]
MKISDVLRCMGWAAFSLFASLWVPFAGPFFSLLTPLPFLYYSTKLGFYNGLKLAGLGIFAVGVIGRLIGQPQIVLFYIQFSLLGLFLAQLFRWDLSIGKTVFSGTVLMVSIGFLFLLITAISKNTGPFEMVLNYIRDNLKETISVYEKVGVSPETAFELESFKKTFLFIISRIYPSLMIIGTSFTVWLNIVIARPLFKAGKLEYPSFYPLDRWKTPDSLVWVVIVSGFSLFFLSGNIKLLAINTLIVAMAVYFFHGLSIMLFFLEKYHVPSWIRIGVYILIIVQQLFVMVLILAGLFDQWIDFRKIHKRAVS